MMRMKRWKNGMNKMNDKNRDDKWTNEKRKRMIIVTEKLPREKKKVK